jgi:DNA-directed RNA polymerase specialized sigma24 family protein
LSPTDSQWELTQKALDNLLALFSADPDEAAAKYLAMKRKLQRFFEWNLFPNADELVDLAVNRVARKLEEGEKIFNLNGYFRAVAKLIVKEQFRLISRFTSSDDDPPDPPAPNPDEDLDKEQRLKCLDECLEKLPIESRTLILNYYSYEERNKIGRRKQLAKSLGIPMNALRIRAYRLRSSLETCMENCLGSLA